MHTYNVANRKLPAEILLVEDNRGDAVLAARAFSKAHIPIHLQTAESAEDALMILHRKEEHTTSPRPDLILLDLNLPKMHGHEFLDIIKADDRFRHIPVIILSSSRVKQDIIRSYVHYASGYVIKPLGADQYKDLVDAVEQFYFKAITLPDSPDDE